MRLENVGEECQVLFPTWEIGNSRGRGRGTRFSHKERRRRGGPPEIPEELSEVQRRSLQKLLDEYKDVFVGKDFRLGSTGVVKHGVHTHGAPIR